MGMAREETGGDRGEGGARGETVAALAIVASTAYADHADMLRSRGAEIARHIGRSELATRSLICRHRSRLRDAVVAA